MIVLVRAEHSGSVVSGRRQPAQALLTLEDEGEFILNTITYQNRSSSNRASRWVSALTLCGGALLLRLPSAYAASARASGSGAARTKTRIAYPTTIGMTNADI